MERTFRVLTQHGDDGRFIVPTNIDAPSAWEAAKKRFGMQIPSSQRDTTALLVDDRHQAHVYPVSSTPRVADAALVI